MRKSSGTWSKNVCGVYLCSLSEMGTTGLRSLGSRLFQVPGSRMIRSRLNTESVIQPWAVYRALMCWCHHWDARRPSSCFLGGVKQPWLLE